MMINMSPRILFLTSLTFFPFLIGASGSIPKNNLALVDEKVESSFLVINEEVIPKISDSNTCENDNRYMLSAFKEKNVLLQDYDYSVSVSRKIYSYDINSNTSSLEVFHYEINFLDFDYTMKKSFQALTNVDFIETYMPISKAPTKCYAFIVEEKLNLMCHYGFIQHSIMPEIIEHLIQK